MSRYIRFFLLQLICIPALAQDDLFFYGSFESNSQLLQDDEGIDFESPTADFRSNNYFNWNFNFKKFSAGLQYESYLPEPLLGYDPLLEGNGIAHYYVEYESELVELTAGYFYEQFGSGLILRLWEDRQLGINNALRGVRAKFKPKEFLDITALYGQQRNGFEISESTVGGIDLTFDIANSLELEEVNISLGASVVNRFQENGGVPEVPSSVTAFAARFELGRGSFFSEGEYVYKQPDVLVYNRSITNDMENFPGSAWLLNLGYAEKSLGVNVSFRRLENFSFYADRFAEGNSYNRLLINYVPALTKQHDYLLNNIYVYSAQPRLILNSAQKQSGEIGFQGDLFFTLKPDSLLGGAYGTKLEINYSQWWGLDATYDVQNNTYTSVFFGAGANYFREYGLAIRKKWNSHWSGIYSFTQTRIDKGVTVGSPLGFNLIDATVLVAENTYRFDSESSVRLELQHLWTEQDRGNWAAAVLEYNFNPSLGIFFMDSWNYDYPDPIHYYNVGGSFTKGSGRVALNYGRQRGGLICVGGVCRFVPENTGFSLNLQLSF